MKTEPTFLDFLKEVLAIFGDKMSGRLYFFWGAILALASGLVTTIFGNEAHAIPGKYVALAGGVVAAVIAFYGAWRKERVTRLGLEERLESKIRLVFDAAGTKYVHKTNEGTSSELLMVRVWPQCATSVDGCIGFVRAVYEFDGNTWQPTAFEERLDLNWSMKGSSPLTIQKGVPQFLDVFQISGSRKKIELCANSIPNRATAVFKASGIYRIDIGVIGSGGANASLSLKVSMSTDWDKPEIMELPGV
jgi:hypothetical protein